MGWLGSGQSWRAPEGPALSEPLPGEKLFQDESGLESHLILVEISGHDRKRLFGAGDVELPKDVAQIIQIVERLAQPHGGALHGQQALRAGRKNASTSCVAGRASSARHMTAPPTRYTSPSTPRDPSSSSRSSKRRRISARVNPPGSGIPVPSSRPGHPRRHPRRGSDACRQGGKPGTRRAARSSRTPGNQAVQLGEDVPMLLSCGQSGRG